MYGKSKFIRERDKDDENLDLSEGGWRMPSCCPIFINLIQFCVIAAAIYIQKGTSYSFFLPDFQNQYMIYDKNGNNVFDGI